MFIQYLWGLKPGFSRSSLKVQVGLENWGPKMYFCKFQDSDRSICVFHPPMLRFNGIDSVALMLKVHRWFMVDSFESYFISFLDKINLNKKTPNIWVQKRNEFESYFHLTLSKQSPTMWIVGIPIHHAWCFNDFTISGMPPLTYQEKANNHMQKTITNPLEGLWTERIFRLNGPFQRKDHCFSKGLFHQQFKGDYVVLLMVRSIFPILFAKSSDVFRGKTVRLDEAFRPWTLFEAPHGSGWIFETGNVKLRKKWLEVMSGKFLEVPSLLLVRKGHRGWPWKIEVIWLPGCYSW